MRKSSQWPVHAVWVVSNRLELQSEVCRRCPDYLEIILQSVQAAVGFKTRACDGHSGALYSGLDRWFLTPIAAIKPGYRKLLRKRRTEETL